MKLHLNTVLNFKIAIRCIGIRIRYLLNPLFPIRNAYLGYSQLFLAPAERAIFPVEAWLREEACDLLTTQTLARGDGRPRYHT